MKRSYDTASAMSAASSSNSSKSLQEATAANSTDRMDFDDMDAPNVYQVALKKVNLVERSSTTSDCGLVAERQLSRHKHSATDIVALASQISHADAAIKHQATGKLSLILEQIQFLQRQAQKVLDETNVSQRLHSAACNFRKHPGTVYHLYQRESGQFYISLLSPEEWGLGLPHRFQGSYRLEADSSWTPIDRLAEVNKKNAWAAKLMAATDEATAKSSFLAIE